MPVMKALPNKVEINSKQERAWMETRTKLLADAPMFSHLLYTMMTHDDNIAYFTDDPQFKSVAAGTDDKTLFINPENFFDRPLPHRVFIAAHEVVHAMFGHAGQAATFNRLGEVTYNDGTRVPFNDEMFQRAQDYYVNALLVDGKIGTLPPDGQYDAKYSTDMSVLDIYKLVYEEQEGDDQGGAGPGSGQGGPGDGQGSGDGGFDEHLPPGAGQGQSPEQAMQDRNEDEWRTQIEAAMQGAKTRGQLPASMEAAIMKSMEPVVDWQSQIEALFARKLGVGSYDWSKPDRRMISRADPIFAPGRIGFGCKLIVVIADSSGSIGDKTASHFFTEMSGILEDLKPEEIKFVWCDARTHGWETLEDSDDLARVERAGIKGGGGTSFIPPFIELHEMGDVPDAVVYLTDGDGCFPDEEPPYTVIWGDISGTPSKYPWGSVVHIPVQN